MQRPDNRFEQLDCAALHNALLALHTCPHCRADLRPVAFLADVWGCANCRETWYLEPDTGEELTPQKIDARERAAFAARVAQAEKWSRS